MELQEPIPARSRRRLWRPHRAIDHHQVIEHRLGQDCRLSPRRGEALRLHHAFRIWKEDGHHARGRGLGARLAGEAMGRTGHLAHPDGPRCRCDAFANGDGDGGDCQRGPAHAPDVDQRIEGCERHRCSALSAATRPTGRFPARCAPDGRGTENRSHQRRYRRESCA